MNVVDSSGWLEFFADGPNADSFTPPLSDRSTLIVPTITIYEVFKVVCRQRGEDAALQAAALMRQGTLVELSPSLAMVAARTSLDLGLPMADSIILATARLHDALLWTQDEHFQKLPGVRYFPKPGTVTPVEAEAKPRNQQQQTEHLEMIHTILEQLPEEEKAIYQRFGFGERARMYKMIDYETDPVKMQALICTMIKAISEK